MVTCEVCVEGIGGALAAARGGADRIELCAGLVEGGTTPSFGVITGALKALSIPAMVLNRPRGGDFLYSGEELDVMRRDIGVAREAGAHGVVTGALTPEGDVDREATARLREEAGTMSFTFHRAFDMTRDPLGALETLVELGVDRILTSGQARSVPEGLGLIRELNEAAGARIIVMPGAGIRAENVGAVLRETCVREIHFTAFVQEESPMIHRNPAPLMGASRVPGEYDLLTTSPGEVRRIMTAAAGATEAIPE